MKNPISVSFDANVNEDIVVESKRLRNKNVDIDSIYLAIQKKIIEPFISETIFTLEAIAKADRFPFLSDWVAGKANAHATFNSYVQEHFASLLALNYKILRFPRTGGIDRFVNSPHVAPDTRYSQKTRQERTFECARKIEARGCGFEWMRKAAATIVPGASVSTYLATKISDHEFLKKFPSAVAEWSDGDSIAAHYGYGIDYFCTLDSGKNAGENSIMHPSNRTFLKNELGLKIVSPSELNTIISNSSK